MQSEVTKGTPYSLVPQALPRHRRGGPLKYSVARGDECTSRVCMWNAHYLFPQGTAGSDDPCDDFYGHVCAAFQYNSEFPNKLPYSSFSTAQLVLNLDSFFKAFLAVKRARPRSISSNFLAQAMWVHEECKAAGTREDDAKALSAWAEVLHALQISGWPYVNFTGDIVKLVSTGDRYLRLDSLFSVKVFRGDGKVRKPHVVLSAPTTFLRRHVTSGKLVRSYQDSIARTLGMHTNPETASLVCKRISRLEVTLHSLSFIENGPTILSVKDLWSIVMLSKRSSERWNWVLYFSSLFMSESVDAKSKALLIEDPAFFARFSSVFDTDDYRTTIANYVGFKAMVTFSPFLPSKYQYLYQFLYGYEIVGTDTQLVACSVLLEKMYRYGVGLAMKLAPNGVFADVYRRHYEDQFAALFNETRSILKNFVLSRHSWFAHEDISGALKKLDNLTLVFGSQDDFIKYEGYRQTPAFPVGSEDHALSTVFRIFSYASSLYWEPVGHRDHEMPAYDNAHSVSAFDWDSEYQPHNNLAFIPNAIVGFLSVVSNTIPVQLYPVVLMHVVRSALRPLLRSNSLFDNVLSPRKWWNAESVEAYESVSECLRRQYETSAAIESEDATSAPFMPTIASRDEAFLDNAVLWPLYRMYERALDYFNATRLFYRLSGRNVSARELFFYNYAAAFCDGSNRSSLLEQRALGVTPAKMRVNLPLSGFPPFQEAFSCANAKRRTPLCQVWKNYPQNVLGS